MARLQGARCPAGTRYSVAHALLAALPHEAAVTTNSDLCYDEACGAAGVSVNLLPYSTRFTQRWLLKLHGDINHPEDVVLAYSSDAPYGTGKEALAGIVQAMLITKHITFNPNPNPNPKPAPDPNPNPNPNPNTNPGNSRQVPYPCSCP